jgi:uncharacterized membrane protein YvbJ
MFCKKCGTKNEEDMTFCQNCGESLKSERATEVITSTGNTIKVFANIICIFVIIIGIVTIITGWILTSYMETPIPVVIGLIVGIITILLGYVSRAFTYGYGIIVSYCERRDKE